MLSRSLSNTEEATDVLALSVPQLRKFEASPLSEEDADLVAEVDGLGDVTISKGSEKLDFHVATKQPVTFTATKGKVHIQLGFADVEIPETSREDQLRHLAKLGVEASKSRVQKDFKGANNRIPRKLIFVDTRYHNLDSYPREVQDNLRRTLDMNPGYEVTWFDDAACVAYMKQHAVDPRLVQKYQDLMETNRAGIRFSGMFRSDICRAAYLFHEGGFYTDSDVEPAVPFAQMVDKDTGFMSAWEGDGETFTGGVMNCLIGVEPNSPIIKRQLEVMQTTMQQKDWYNGHFGPQALGQGLKDLMSSCHEDPTTIVQKSDFTACGTKVRMFQEENFMKPDTRTPASLIEKTRSKRGQNGFIGHDYAYFYTGDPPALIGFPRFAACIEWGCGL